MQSIFHIYEDKMEHKTLLIYCKADGAFFLKVCIRMAETARYSLNTIKHHFNHNYAIKIIDRRDHKKVIDACINYPVSELKMKELER